MGYVLFVPVVFLTSSVVEVDLDETMEGGGGGVSVEHYLPRHLCAVIVQRLRGEGEGRKRVGGRK